MALRRRWARPRPRRPGRAQALALAAALAAALPLAACTPAPASSGSGSAAAARRSASPDITVAQAHQVFDRYAAARAAGTAKPGSRVTWLSLETGPQRAYDSASLRSVITSASGYHAPTFYLPERSGYPRFFVAGTATAPVAADGAETRPSGPGLMLFEQSSAGARWLLASTSRLAAGEALPKLAADNAGYVPTVPLADAALLAPPEDAGALQAAVVDDGPASAAARVVAPGPLTTGLFQGALSRANGMTAPRGDIYQWELDGASYPQFALRTADGGALVFYAMTLNSTVAVPGVINKGDPVRPGPPIPVPADVRRLLPPGRPAPLVQLQSQQVLTFTAIDPPAGKSKIRVITMGGGLTSAAAS